MLTLCGISELTKYAMFGPYHHVNSAVAADRFFSVISQCSITLKVLWVESEKLSTGGDQLHEDWSIFNNMSVLILIAFINTCRLSRWVKAWKEKCALHKHLLRRTHFSLPALCFSASWAAFYSTLHSTL